MKKAFVQLFVGIGIIIAILWVIVFFGRSIVRGETVAHPATPPVDRYEVGADTGDVHVVAYSMAEGDAYVKIDGDTIYAEARLRGPVSAPPTATPSPTAATPLPPATTDQPTSTQTQTPTPDLVTLTFTSVANIRSAPWGAVLGSAQPGESYTATGVANPWYQFTWMGQTAWARGDLVSINGDTSTLPLVSISVAEPVAVAPTPTDTPIQSAPVEQAPTFPFVQSNLLQEVEANHPAFYVKIAQNGNPAADRWCVVFHDGKEVGRSPSINVFSISNLGTPWTTDDNPYNCEVKFHDYDPEPWPGNWVIEVQDGARTTVGRSEVFIISQGLQQVWIEFLRSD
jgi:hypothetical protein